MATSEVAICNRALNAIGAGSEITSLTENTPEAEICRRFYPDLRDAVLRDANWNFAVKRAQLSVRDATDPVFGFKFAYQMPNDYVRMLGVYGPYNRPVYNPESWSIENKLFLTDLKAPVNIRYVYKITDVQMFPQDFQEALIYRLAAEICEALENNSSLRADMYALYQERLRAAKHNGSIERSPVQLIYEGNINRARFGGRRYGTYY